MNNFRDDHDMKTEKEPKGQEKNQFPRPRGWVIRRIEEADYGCEERMPGEPLMVLVTLENDFGQTEQLEVADCWLAMQELEEGDEWPEDPDQVNERERNMLAQNQWMDRYMEAVEELQELK